MSTWLILMEIFAVIGWITTIAFIYYWIKSESGSKAKRCKCTDCGDQHWIFDKEDNIDIDDPDNGTV